MSKKSRSPSRPSRPSPSARQGSILLREANCIRLSTVTPKESRASKRSPPGAGGQAEVEAEEDNYDYDSTTPTESKQKIAANIMRGIVDTAVQEIYQKYLEKQTVYFVSHCSLVAWKALVEWNHQRKDVGGFVRGEGSGGGRGRGRSCSEDVEPESSAKDSWAGHSVRVGPRVSRAATGTGATGTEVSDSETGEETDESSVGESRLITDEPLGLGLGLESAQSMLESKYKPGAGAFQYLKDVLIKQVRQTEEGVGTKKGDKNVTESRKESYELPAPVAIPAKHFPSAWVEVQYAISPSKRDVTTRKKPKTKTIRLKKVSKVVETPKQEG